MREKRRLSFVHVLEKMPPGGAEIMVRRLAARLAAREEFTPLVVGFEGGRLSELIAGDGVALEVLGLSRRPVRAFPSFIVSMTRIMMRLRNLLKRERAVVVHGHMIDAGMLSTAVARSLGIPSVITFHSTSLLPSERLTRPSGLRRSARLGLLRRFSGVPDSNVAVSSEVKRVLVEDTGWDPDRVRIIRNGVPLNEKMDTASRIKARSSAREKLGIEKDAAVIISAGRLVANKGHRHLVEAAAELRKQYPGLKLIIAGEGPERKNLERLAVELGCEDSVRLPGFAPDPALYFAAADLFALPSYWEGLPLALIEAMSYSLPVIASAAPGIDSVISDGVDGLLFPVADHESIARAAAVILGDDALAESLGRLALEKATREFDLDSTVNLHVELYRSLIL